MSFAVILVSFLHIEGPIVDLTLHRQICWISQVDRNSWFEDMLTFATYTLSRFKFKSCESVVFEIAFLLKQKGFGFEKIDLPMANLFFCVLFPFLRRLNKWKVWPRLPVLSGGNLTNKHEKTAPAIDGAAYY
jgi:hypothetical protein